MASKGSTASFMNICLLIFLTNVISSWQLCDEEKLWVIRSTHPTGLVLDGTNQEKVQVQHYHGFRTQLWRIVTGGTPGSFYIINDYTGNALDYKTDSSAILATRSRSLTQQWSYGFFNDSGKLTSLSRPINLDITGQNFVAGNPVGVWNDGDYPNQKWIFWQKV